MNSRPYQSLDRRHGFKHVLAMILLTGLNFNRKLRSRLKRAFLRVSMGMLGVVLAIIVLSSLTALLRITSSVKSLISDALVGVEATVSMRSAMRETRIDLLHLRLDSDLRISAHEVTELQQAFSRLLKKYRSGAFENEDLQNADAIEAALRTYIDTLQPLIGNSQPTTIGIETADAAGGRILDLIEQAYEYNRTRLHKSAQEATVAAENALQLSKRLWWGFVVVMVTVLLFYSAYRWLTLPDEND